MPPKRQRTPSLYPEGRPISHWSATLLPPSSTSPSQLLLRLFPLRRMMRRCCRNYPPRNCRVWKSVSWKLARWPTRSRSRRLIRPRMILNSMKPPWQRSSPRRQRSTRPRAGRWMWCPRHNRLLPVASPLRPQITWTRWMGLRPRPNLTPQRVKQPVKHWRATCRAKPRWIHWPPGWNWRLQRLT